MERIAKKRKQESLDGYYAGLTQEQLDGIEAAPIIDSIGPRLNAAGLSSR